MESIEQSLETISDLLDRWIEISQRQTAAAKAGDFETLDALLTQRSSLMPSIAHFVAEQNRIEELIDSCGSEVTARAGDALAQFRKSLPERFALAVQLDTQCVEMLEEAMSRLSSEMQHVQRAKGAGFAYKTGSRIPEARFLDQES